MNEEGVCIEEGVGGSIVDSTKLIMYYAYNNIICIMKYIYAHMSFSLQSSMSAHSGGLLIDGIVQAGMARDAACHS